MKFYPGFDISPTRKPLGFQCGKDVFGPEPEVRRLSDIRKSLMDPLCTGPDELYGIVMDVGRMQERQEIRKRNLLYGAVTYTGGMLGKEPIRSQGHIHAVSPSCGSSTPEVYEIWEGEAIIYMQHSSGTYAGNCYAVRAKEGEVVIVPPGWMHAAINASIRRNMTFGAWCVRDFRFDYEDVRKQKGIAYFPVISEYGGQEQVVWEANKAYTDGNLIIKRPEKYTEFYTPEQTPIYTQFVKDMEKFRFVTNPAEYNHLWEGFVP